MALLTFSRAPQTFIWHQRREVSSSIQSHSNVASVAFGT